MYDVSSAKYQFHPTPSPFYPPPKTTDKKFQPLQIYFYNIREFMDSMTWNIEKFKRFSTLTSTTLSKLIHIYHAESRNVGGLNSTTINRAIPEHIVFLYVKNTNDFSFHL